jgi:DHA1 family bicyclomycin/chloramphenicol resistance-like MFS transporter
MPKLKKIKMIISGKEKNFGVLAAVVLLVSSVIRTGACLYLPAMPSIAKQLNIHTAAMGLTITIYFLVFSGCILVAGPLSDAFGRKKIILSGLIIFGLGSVLCGTATSFWSLLPGRIVQAAGASLIPGTSRAAVRDAGDDIQVVSIMGWLAVLSSVMLVGAPIAGGFITRWFQWRGNFAVLAILSLMMFFMAMVFMPETLPKNLRTNLTLSKTFKQYYKIIMSYKFMLLLAPVICFFAFQGAYLVAAPFIFIHEYGLTPIQFGLSNIIVVVALMIGRHISVTVSKQHNSAGGLRIASWLTMFSVVLFAAVLWLRLDNIYAAFVTLGVFAISFGTVLPIGMKESITLFRDQSGMAAAVQGSLLLGATAIGSMITSEIIKHLEYIPILYIFVSINIVLALMIILLLIPAKSILEQ